MKHTFTKLLLLIKTIENFPTAILDRLGFVKGEVIYKVRNSDLQFIARGGTEDMAEIAVITSGSEYKLELLDIPDNPVIVDLGCHIGTFSIPMARMYEKAKIYAFEPDTDNYKILKRNIALNGVKTIKLFKSAVSDYVGRGLLKNDTGNTDAYYLDFNKSDTSNCEVTTLPAVMSPYKPKQIDILKMDIEGGEYKILMDKKSYAYILKKVRYMLMEHHPVDSYYNYSLIKKLIKKDFKILNTPSNVLILENRSRSF